MGDFVAWEEEVKGGGWSPAFSQLLICDSFITSVVGQVGLLPPPTASHIAQKGQVQSRTPLLNPPPTPYYPLKTMGVLNNLSFLKMLG